MTSTFTDAIDYVLSNEGGDSNDAGDRGGLTRFGITFAEATSHGLDIKTLTVDRAKAVYLADYWRFDGIADQRVATKILDVVVNTGVIGGTKVVQRAVGVTPDGVYGPATQTAINTLAPEDALEQISQAVADRYVGICLNDATQLKFLRGWIRRAIRRPRAQT